MKNIGTRAQNAFPTGSRPAFRRSEAAAILAQCLTETGHLNSLVVPELMRLRSLDVELTPDLVTRVIAQADETLSRRTAEAERARELAEAGRRFTLRKFGAPDVSGDVG